MQSLVVAGCLCLSLVAAGARAQPRDVPLSPEAWTASDSIRFETYLGRQSLYINKGVALARNVALENGSIEYDMAATPVSNFVGASFRALSVKFSEVVFFRLNQSGTTEAIQYAPALSGVAAAWQVFHGDGANASAAIPRERWFHVKIELDGRVARIYFDTATTPTLTVRRLAGTGGRGLGVWTGAFGRGAYFSNIRYAPSPIRADTSADPPPPRGTITNWELSNAIEAAQFTPRRLPPPTAFTWQRVVIEPSGFVLVNRYREAPIATLPANSATNEALADSVMAGRVAGSRVVFARTIVDADRAEVRRLQYGYSDGVVIYVNGEPLVFAMNPQNLRDLGIMPTIGDAVYVRLRPGHNELVFAVIELGGGWAFWGRLDPP